MGGPGCSLRLEGVWGYGGRKPPSSPKCPVLVLWGQRGPVPCAHPPAAQPKRSSAPVLGSLSQHRLGGFGLWFRVRAPGAGRGSGDSPWVSSGQGEGGESGQKAALPFIHDRLRMRVPAHPAWGPHALGTQGRPWLRRGLSRDSARGRRHQGKCSVAEARSYRAPNTEQRATPCIVRVPALPQGTLQQAGQEKLSPSPALRNQACGLSPRPLRRQQGRAGQDGSQPSSSRAV